MLEVIENAKANVESCDTQAAMNGRALVKRMNITKRLVDNIRDAKNSRKEMNRNNISTKHVDAALKIYREELTKSVGIQMQLRAMYSRMCQQYRKELEIFQALEELQTLKKA